MSTIDNLQQASFRDIPFLVPTESITKGIKTAVHEYIDSDDRFIEEFGKTPPTFALRCLIHGDDSINNRIRFEQALDQGGFGKLVHPIYGTLQVKVIGDYTVSSSQRKIGEHAFDVTFGVSRENIAPSVEFVSNNEISNQAINNLDTLRQRLAQDYEELSAAVNIEASASTYSQILTSFTDAIDKVEEGIIPDNVSIFLDEVEKIRGDIYNVVRQPANISNKFTTLFSRFRTLTSTPANLLTSFRSLIDTTVTFIPSNTFLRKQRRNNVLLLEEFRNLGALNFLYESAIYTDFKTDIELMEMQELIADYYTTFFDQQIDNNSDLGTMTEKISVRDNFAALNALFSKALIIKEQNVWKVKEVEDKSTTLLMAYKYFGDLQALDIINELNPGVNHAGFDGKILMVSK